MSSKLTFLIINTEEIVCVIHRNCNTMVYVVIHRNFSFSRSGKRSTRGRNEKGGVVVVVVVVVVVIIEKIVVVIIMVAQNKDMIIEEMNNNNNSNNKKNDMNGKKRSRGFDSGHAENNSHSKHNKFKRHNHNSTKSSKNSRQKEITHLSAAVQQLKQNDTTTNTNNNNTNNESQFPFVQFDDLPISNGTKSSLMHNDYIVMTAIQRESIPLALAGEGE